MPKKTKKKTDNPPKKTPHRHFFVGGRPLTKTMLSGWGGVVERGLESVISDNRTQYAHGGPLVTPPRSAAFAASGGWGRAAS